MRFQTMDFGGLHDGPANPQGLFGPGHLADRRDGLLGCFWIASLESPVESHAMAAAVPPGDVESVATGPTPTGGCPFS